MRGQTKKPLARALREACAKGLGGTITTENTIPQPRPLSSQAAGKAVASGGVPAEIDLTPAGDPRRRHGLVVAGGQRGMLCATRRGVGQPHAGPGVFFLTSPASSSNHPPTGSIATFLLTQPPGSGYGNGATEKNVVWFGSQAIGGTIHRHSCTIERRFFASASWLCSFFWASQAGSLKTRRFLLPGLPTCLDSPFFRLEAKKGGKPFPPAIGVQAMHHPFPRPAGSPSTVPHPPRITINGKRIKSMAELQAIIAAAFCLGGGRHV